MTDTALLQDQGQEREWTDRRRKLWRAKYASIWLGIGSVVGGGLLTVAAWLIGLETEAQASAQHDTIRHEFKIADDAVKGWATDQDKVVQTRFEGISKRIDDQSALLKEIRDYIMKDKHR